MRRAALWLVLVLAASLTGGPTAAHEVRPAYLQIERTGETAYDFFWKVPVRGGRVPALGVALPGDCADTAERLRFNDGAAEITRWSSRCTEPIAGRALAIGGLDRSPIETIIRYQPLEGDATTLRLFEGRSEFTIGAASSFIGVASVYLPLGIEHILFGFDHLLFVLALLLLVDGLRRLFWAITAFTLAHSITLGAATLGLVSVPVRPVEALIAFSIVLVAAEVIHARHGERRLTAERPWLVSFSFGLLHGFGFASALAGIGMPEDAVPAALFFFNLGVEFGQLIFVAAAALVFALSRRLVPAATAAAPGMISYGIGSLAAFWTIERIVT